MEHQRGAASGLSTHASEELAATSQHQQAADDPQSLGHQQLAVQALHSLSQQQYHQQQVHQGGLDEPSVSGMQHGLQPHEAQQLYAAAASAYAPHQQQQQQLQQQQLQQQQLQGSYPAAKVPAARREEVQRLLGQALVIKCDQNYPLMAPVVVMSTDENSIYGMLERHLKPEYLSGPERFWKQLRTTLGVDTWRPRVQGAQLKALANARLPETEAELQQLEAVIQMVPDSLKEDSSAVQMMAGVRAFIKSVQLWWENRNKRADGSGKRSLAGGPTSAPKRDKRAPEPMQAGIGPGSAAMLLSGINMGMGRHGSFTLPDRSGSGLPATGFMDMNMLSDEVRGTAGARDQAQGEVAQLQRNTLQLQDLRSLVSLDVGGHRCRTTLETLLAVQGSYFWNLINNAPDPDAVLPRTPAGDFFIDRNGAVFPFVVEYLRACVNGEMTFPLPDNIRDLQALAREAQFYGLPGLLEHIQNTSLMPQPGTRTYYDSLYLETGFKSIEGPSLKEMEKCKVVVMQQMNHVLSLRAQDGFYVDHFKCGVNHRADEEGAMQHNLFYNILLKKVVPLLPRQRQPNQQQQQQAQQPQQAVGPPLSSGMPMGGSGVEGGLSAGGY